MKVCAILVHGFNVTDSGFNTIDKLEVFFQERGVTPIRLTYGYFGLLQTRFFNKKVARRVVEAVHNAKIHYDRVIVVGHSNGCAISFLASGFPELSCDAFCWINPALDPEATPGYGVDTIHVWYSPSDFPVKLASLIPKPFKKTWGNMGSEGYKGKDPRVMNFNKEEGFPVESSKHSDVFTCEKIAYFGPVIVDRLLDSILD